MALNEASWGFTLTCNNLNGFIIKLIDREIRSPLWTYPLLSEASTIITSQETDSTGYCHLPFKPNANKIKCIAREYVPIILSIDSLPYRSFLLEMRPIDWIDRTSSMKNGWQKMGNYWCQKDITTLRIIWYLGYSRRRDERIESIYRAHTFVR